MLPVGHWPVFHVKHRPRLPHSPLSPTETPQMPELQALTAITQGGPVPEEKEALTTRFMSRLLRRRDS